MRDYGELYRYIDGHAEEFIALLQQFCRQPSISSQGLGLREMAQLICRTFQNLGVKPDLMETGGAPIVYAEIAGRNPARTVTFYNHYDVQPVEPPVCGNGLPGGIRPAAFEREIHLRR